jgi:protein-S-isoprenylcysteine O-methyltransferase Ste14
MTWTPATIVALLFFFSELLLGIVRRSRGGEATSRDRGSMIVLWAVITVAIFGAILCAKSGLTRLPLSFDARQITAIAVMVAGLAFRWVSILTLGRFFTVNVAAHADHQLVDFGPYRLIRHPSYTGLLIAFVGLAIYFGTWVGLAVMMVPITLALLYRIRVEEEALGAALGARYEAYRARTKRLIPGVL